MIWILEPDIGWTVVFLFESDNDKGNNSSDSKIFNTDHAAIGKSDQATSSTDWIWWSVVLT